MTLKGQNNITFSNSLLQLLGIQRLLLFTFVKRLNSPTTYFVHCDLIDKRQNLLNGNVSKALADKSISDVEFRIISREVEKHHELKATIRDGVTKTQEAATQTQAPDL